MRFKTLICKLQVGFIWVFLIQLLYRLFFVINTYIDTHGHKKSLIRPDYHRGHRNGMERHRRNFVLFEWYKLRKNPFLYVSLVQSNIFAEKHVTHTCLFIYTEVN